MKVLASTLLVGLATAAVRPPQNIFQMPKVSSDRWSKPLETLRDTLKDMTNEAMSTWEEVAAMFPEAMEAATFFSSPKPHKKRPDHEWDHIIKGADVQSVWIADESGEKHRDVGGKLENYNLRAKAVDPKKLGIDPGVKQYSGYLDDMEDDKHLFYWFFESRNDPKNDPVVLWLNGGPGCSSLTGLFLELGPSSIDAKLKPVNNPYSWNANASVIFLDQPVNVGFSYSGSSVSNTVAASKDVYALLTLFFKQFPEYAKQDFHIAGESYAGHYIPVFASEILSHKNTNINLKSVLIGNGLTDGLTQYEYYKPMACGEGGWPAVLSKGECQAMENSYPRCASLIQNCYDSDSIWSCVPAAIYCNNAMIGPYQRTGQNVYDIRGKCEDSSNLCYKELGWISDYLNQKSVQDALGVEVSSYDSCNFDINRNFLLQGDWMKPFHRLVPGILEKIPVLIYAGDADYICNWLGNKAWSEALEWPGHDDFSAAPMKNLTLDTYYSSEKSKSFPGRFELRSETTSKLKKGDKIGEVKTSGNFTFMRIFAAGHMVPLNQPEASLEFFNRWLGGEWM